MAAEIRTIDHPVHFLKQFGRENIALAIDENVFRHYGDHFDPYPNILIKSGEQQKDLRRVEMVISYLMDSGLDRNATIIGIGGGVVCDIAGFVASIYLRGIRFGFLPTTLLAMCDAAIGGKNGVNFHGAKNMVGLINEPVFIAYYLPFLDTLADSEFLNGMAEVIKHAFLDSQASLEFLKKNHGRIKQRDMGILAEMIDRSRTTKAHFVKHDLYEEHERKKLNLGHTIGHAIESTTSMAHGQSISIGMVMAAKISWRMGLCSEPVVREIEEALSLFQLPVSLNANPEAVIQNIKFDKKRRSGDIDLILPVSPGRVEIMPVGLEDLINHIKAIPSG
jgi:3-dehydroquinate synthase